MTWYYALLLFLAVMCIFKIYYMTVIEKRRLEIEDIRKVNKKKDDELHDTIIKQESKRPS